MGRKRSKSRSYSDDEDREDSDSSRNERDEVRTFWRPVEDDPQDFDAWTRLLQYVEQRNDSKIASEAFDSFLKRYPYCFGYWRKYAELERRNHHYEKALNVYERGVKEISLSVDLWLSYIGYIKEIGAGQKQAVSKTRAIYMRALDACGLDFRSDKLWEQYIEWEVSINNLQRASQVYDILLSTPTFQFESQFDRYKQFISLYEPDKILGDQEYESISDKVYERVKDDLDGGPMFFMEDFEEEIPEDEQTEDGLTTRTSQRRKHVEVALVEFRREIIDRRAKLYQTNGSAVDARLKFEKAIKRPYFHVKPLERDQLLNWLNYLDFEIGENKKKRIQVLFERCVISCALYEEMWIKYAAYYDLIGETDRAREIYQKAADIHCSRKPGIQLAYSVFEEKHGKSLFTHAICPNNYNANSYKQNLKGDASAALSILKEFDRKYSGYVAISMRMINIDRRREFKDEKSPDYASVIRKLEKLMNEPGNTRRVTSFYALKLARFHSKICHERRLAKTVIKDAITRDKDNLQLYMALVDIAFGASHYRESEVVSAFDYAIESKYLSTEQRFLFSQRKMDFLEEIGNDPGLLQQHYVDHLKLEKQLEEPSPTLFSNLKRKAAPSEEEPTEKRVFESNDNGNQLNASPVVWITPDGSNLQPMVQQPFII